MKIIYINTQNKLLAKDMLIKAAIKTGMHYVEMETEILIEDNLIRITEEPEINKITNLIDFNQKKLEKNFEIIDIVKKEENQFVKPMVPKLTKQNYKSESKRVNDKLKIKKIMIGEYLDEKSSN